VKPCRPSYSPPERTTRHVGGFIVSSGGAM
jgi:hypothetical protein